MKVEKYHLKSESTFTRFEFVSEGTNGAIKKLIEFKKLRTLKFLIWHLGITVH